MTEQNNRAFEKMAVIRKAAIFQNNDSFTAYYCYRHFIKDLFYNDNQNES